MVNGWMVIGIGRKGSVASMSQWHTRLGTGALLGSSAPSAGLAWTQAVSSACQALFFAGLFLDAALQ